MTVNAIIMRGKMTSLRLTSTTLITSRSVNSRLIPSLAKGSKSSFRELKEPLKLFFFNPLNH
jgi:hypothetical protein